MTNAATQKDELILRAYANLKAVRSRTWRFQVTLVGGRA